MLQAETVVQSLPFFDRTAVAADPSLAGDLLGAWLAAFCTLAVFSFLYRDNPVYKIAEHLFVGIGAAYYVTVHMLDTLEPDLVVFLWDGLRGEVVTGPEGLPWWFRFGGLILGILLLARVFKATTWISRWPLALLVATFAAIKLTTYLAGDLMRQISGTMLAPGDWMSGAALVGQIVLVTGTIAGLVHFLFSVEHKGPVKLVARYGVIILMIAFGSSFGFTVLGRYALLIKRCMDLRSYSAPQYGLASVCLGVLILGFLVVWRARGRGVEE